MRCTWSAFARCPARPEDPQLFTRVFGDQPVGDTPDDLLWLVGQADPATLPALWVGCGTDDPLLDSNVRFVEACAAAGIDVTTSFVEGEHEWGLWDREIQQVLGVAAAAVGEHSVGAARRRAFEIGVVRDDRSRSARTGRGRRGCAASIACRAPGPPSIIVLTSSTPTPSPRARSSTYTSAR